MSLSPAQGVVHEDWSVWRGRCAACGARSDEGGDDHAWRWVSEHLCGAETIALP